MDNELKIRLKTYLEAKEISLSDFGKNVGVSRAYVSALKKTIMPDKLLIIHEKYPDLNLVWLLLGVGEMYNDPKQNAAVNDSEVKRLLQENAELKDKVIDLQGTLLQLCANGTGTQTA